MENSEQENNLKRNLERRVYVIDRSFKTAVIIPFSSISSANDEFGLQLQVG